MRVSAAALLWIAASPGLVRAHPGGGELAPVWSPDYLLLAALAALALLFAAGHARRARRACADTAPHRLQAGAFALCILTLLLALVSPLDRRSDVAFSAHMTQHELLMLVAAPLFVLARPFDTYLWVLPAQARRASARALQRSGLGRACRVLCAPALALPLHGAVRWLWHLPAWFQAALRDEWIHALQHASFFFSAALFWWGIVHGRYGRAGYGASALFVMFTALHTGGLGALLSFGERVWYPLHTLRARQAGLDALADQRLAGLIMWVGAGVWMMLLALGLFLAWLGEARLRAARGQVAALARASAARRTS